MTEEAEVSSEEEQEPVTTTETVGSESETEQTEQETQPEESVEQTDKTFTKAEVEAMFDKRSARIKKQLQREWEEQHPPKQEKAPAPESSDAPKLDDYETTEEWIDARTDWRLEQKERARQQETAAQAEAREKARIKAKYNASASEASDKYADYDDVVEALEDPAIPFYVTSAVQDSDIGGEVAYFLGSNPDELGKLLKLSPFAAVKAIGKLEDKIISKPKPKETSKAPAPFKGVKGDSKPNTMEISPKDDFETFVAKRNYQLGRG